MQETLEINAYRVAEAICKIGYSAEAAVMDIVDNSIEANANDIMITVYWDTEKGSIFRANNIVGFKIIDNGKGMDKEEILNCLTLGSKDEYRPNSLSKYGMGLKSAGFSLGNRISVCSKKNGSLSKYVLDKNKLKETGKWTVLSEDVGEADASDLASFDSGTVIEISDCKTYETPSAETVSRKLNNKAGAVYYHLIKNEQIKIYFRFNKEERMLIDPVDILFREESQDEFSAETYDCKTPVKVYEEDISFSANSNLAKMEIVIFPQARMSTYRFFSDEDRKKIQRYQVNCFVQNRNGQKCKRKSPLLQVRNPRKCKGPLQA